MPAEFKKCPFCGNSQPEEFVIGEYRHVRCGAVDCPIRFQSMKCSEWDRRADIVEVGQQNSQQLKPKIPSYAEAYRDFCKYRSGIVFTETIGDVLESFYSYISRHFLN